MVIVEPDERTGSDEACYAVYCPTLGLSDSGDTIEEALKHMRELIAFHPRALKKDGQPIPTEQTEHSLVATVQVPMPA